jgi:hypothetical protein
MLWQAEYDFLVDDLYRKIAWMEALLVRLGPEED